MVWVGMFIDLMRQGSVDINCLAMDRHLPNFKYHDKISARQDMNLSACCMQLVGA